ncbi:hypothetical protein EDO6_05565 [Paenibacillus xylanexedens]|nr:hypothetical protein EDO6_05565 [Paenibacillus xylanexedens]
MESILEEAKRSPLYPNFNYKKNSSKKFGYNSDHKNDPSPERLRHNANLN